MLKCWLKSMPATKPVFFVFSLTYSFADCAFCLLVVACKCFLFFLPILQNIFFCSYAFLILMFVQSQIQYNSFKNQLNWKQNRSISMTIETGTKEGEKNHNKSMWTYDVHCNVQHLCICVSGFVIVLSCCLCL